MSEYEFIAETSSTAEFYTMADIIEAEQNTEEFEIKNIEF